ncbi:PLP-dependent aspartate aminotransferase family protein [Alicyclobacillus sp.]|uniref:trans-sulfuration enzyme family protein n=1 Tax=Alicyclobacillus sp. TaxID=61169 RepID=UPI0025BAC537|nr:PLP-dependent aspartate aminotransferase family protein [Alicyclobacillus sp.]MCL6517592.1 PLP-dependent aspartate aminotransferase family protein [Alicyclobacillus sp.]
MRIETRLVQAGNRQDPQTGAVVTPIHHATTFAHPALGESTGYDYARLANPTRHVLEEAIATLEGGSRGFAFASGMAAIACVANLLEPGQHVVVSHDLYGGTFRLFHQILPRLGVTATFVDTGDLEAVRSAMRPETRALFLETPTNPTMQISDIRACAEIARQYGAWTVVDNTFMTPYGQRPLELGADIVVHSATKYLGGHNDVLAGLVVVREDALAEQVHFYQNSLGAVLGPQDSWLLLRGMKTLAVRMERHEQNARRVAAWLAEQDMVSRVYYPGLADHPRRAVHEQQATGYGGMVSFELARAEWVAPVLNGVRLITFAESLGGVESLITYPATQTHHEIPKEVRDAVGVNDRLLRLSVGLEHVEDILADLESAFAAARTWG